MSWEPADFDVAMPGGIRRVAGYVFGGLGLHVAVQASPKGRRPAIWSLSHLDTGHRVRLLKGGVSTVFPVAYEIAVCTDWQAFSSLNGWRNTDPALMTKVAEITDRHPTIIEERQGMGSDEATAVAIAGSRAA